MYKKALRLKLRFNTSRGPLSAEQLFDLSMTELAGEIKRVNAELKKETATDDDLAFLEGKDEVKSLNSLRFDILKDVYLTKKQERDDAVSEADKKAYRQKLAEIIDKKRNAALEELSIEELEKKLAATE